jgi:hypothetical protein
MPPILDLIAERETAATATAAALRDQIARLTDQLTRAETELTELAITRKTLMRLTGEAEVTTPLDATIASGPYQQILAVFATTTSPLRAKDVCLALDAAATAKDVEKMRARLKRLVTRQILVETEPGLFTLAPTPPA